MVKTLNEDAFDEGEHGQAMTEDAPVEIVVYGPDGWTDVFNEWTVAHLVGIGAVEMIRDEGNVRYYESRAYTGPDNA